MLIRDLRWPSRMKPASTQMPVDSEPRKLCGEASQMPGISADKTRCTCVTVA